MIFKGDYEVLGATRDSTHKIMKSAYRKLSRKYHPDVSTFADAQMLFKELGGAWALLNDADFCLQRPTGS